MTTDSDDCMCTRGPDYEGPEIDCPVHGEDAQPDPLCRASTVDPTHGKLVCSLKPGHGGDHDTGYPRRIVFTVPGDDLAAQDEPVDLYQQRYIAHQERKAGTLAAILADRHSDRMFGPDDVSRDELETITRCLLTSPTSCNRSGIDLRMITDRDQRALLGGLLVGGVGWIHRAPVVLLLIAQHEAYKAPGELAYMPFLDAGCLLQSMWLTASELGLAAAYANPNIRPAHHGMFADTFLDTSGEGETFCGALAVGHRHPDSPDHDFAMRRDRGIDGEPRVLVADHPQIQCNQRSDHAAHTWRIPLSDAQAYCLGVTGGQSPSILEPCKVTSSHAAHDWPDDAPIRHCPGIK